MQEMEPLKEFSLSYLDIGIMVGYAVLIIAYGLYHAKRNSSEEYFLAGRDMLWPIVGISLFAHYERMAAVILSCFSSFF